MAAAVGIHYQLVLIVEFTCNISNLFVIDMRAIDFFGHLAQTLSYAVSLASQPIPLPQVAYALGWYGFFI